MSPVNCGAVSAGGQLGAPRLPQKVKLFAGMLAATEQLLREGSALLAEAFGPLDYESPLLPFTYTDYYTAELGQPLWRQFVSFARLIDPGELALVKLTTNRLEQVLAVDGRRRVNIDPGYLSLAKVVLATTKDYSHRIYLGLGIYGEVTLWYRQGSYQPWPWTYPDYRSQQYLDTFNQLRALYARQLKELAAAHLGRAERCSGAEPTHECS